MSQNGTRDAEGDAVLAAAMAERLFRKLSQSGEVLELREIFTDAMESYNDVLGVQAVNRWALSYAASNAEGQIDAGMFACLTVMFWEAHAKYRGGAYPMGKTLLAVFGQILALWRPNMSETSIAAFEFCAAASDPMSGQEYEGWTSAMRLFRGKFVHKEDRAAMVGMIRDKANKKGRPCEDFDSDSLGEWIDRYADTVHFSKEILDDLEVAYTRKACVRTEKMRRQVCRHLLVVDASSALRAFLGETVVKQWAKFDKRAMSALSGMWPRGHEGEMARDGIGLWNNFYGTILVIYHARLRVQVDVVLPEGTPTNLCSDMTRRAEARVERFRDLNKDASILIRVFDSGKNLICAPNWGSESFDDIPCGVAEADGE